MQTMVSVPAGCSLRSRQQRGHQRHCRSNAQPQKSIGRSLANTSSEPLAQSDPEPSCCVRWLQHHSPRCFPRACMDWRDLVSAPCGSKALGPASARWRQHSQSKPRRRLQCARVSGKTALTWCKIRAGQKSRSEKVKCTTHDGITHKTQQSSLRILVYIKKKSIICLQHLSVTMLMLCHDYHA